MDDTLKRLIFDGVVRATLEGIFTAVPILRLPILKQVTVALVNAVATALFDELSRRFSFAAIDSEVTKEKVAFEVAVEELKKIPEDAPEEEVESAKEAVRKSVRDLVRIK